MRKLPKIVCSYNPKNAGASAQHYSKVIAKTLHKILPPELQSGEYEPVSYKKKLHSLLPYISKEQCDKAPCQLSFFLFCKNRSSLFKFFYDMISNWLVPGKSLNVIVTSAADFNFPEISEQNYSLCQLILEIEKQSELDQINKNWNILEFEIELGIQSKYHARRILEVKGLSANEKTSAVYERIVTMFERFPKLYSEELINVMQHVMVVCQDAFKEERSTSHLSRIIGVQYLFRKSLIDAVHRSPNRRFCNVKLFQALIGKKSDRKVLSLIIGMNFIKEKESITEKSFFKAISKTILSVHLVKNSFFINRMGKQICTVYLEIEKEEGCSFSKQEIQLLKNELPQELQNNVERIHHPLFMPRNEEEIMRNILVLSDEIRYVRDIPQVIITFDEQTDQHISFTVILLRVLKSKTKSIKEIFKNESLFCDFYHDRTTNVGFLRNKYKKEANVFRVKLNKEDYIRADSAIDINKARHVVVSELSRLFGEFRDYNGGMISKQNELLSKARKILQSSRKINDLLLENFFYSLSPVIMRTLLDPENVKILFVMLMDAIEEGFYNEDKSAFKIRQGVEAVFVMIAVEEMEIKDELKSRFQRLSIPPTSLASSSVQVYDMSYLGYIFLSDDPVKQRLFCEAVQVTIDSWYDQEGRDVTWEKSPPPQYIPSSFVYEPAHL